MADIFCFSYSIFPVLWFLTCCVDCRFLFCSDSGVSVGNVIFVWIICLLCFSAIMHWQESDLFLTGRCCSWSSLGVRRKCSRYVRWWSGWNIPEILKQSFFYFNWKGMLKRIVHNNGWIGPCLPLAQFIFWYNIFPPILNEIIGLKRFKRLLPCAIVIGEGYY